MARDMENNRLYIYESSPLIFDPVSAATVACSILQLSSQIAQLLRDNAKAVMRCRKECKELSELLTSIHLDVEKIELAVKECGRGGSDMAPEVSWLARLGKEVKTTRELIEKWSTSGLGKYIPGDGLPKKISAQKDALTTFAHQLPGLHVGLQNLLWISGQEIRAADFTGIRRLPSYKKHRYPDNEYRSMPDEFWLSVGVVSRLPSFGRYRHPDADYFIRDGVYFRRMPVSPHNPQRVFWSQVSFSRLPVTNPRYFQHIESEYY